MKASLTQNQLRVYTVIRGFIKQNGYSPTYKELMNLLDLRFVTQAARLVQQLEVRSYITRTQGLPRSITLVPDDENEIKKLREIRDAANIFISRQIEFREAYDSNQASPLTALAGPRVTEAYDRLLAMVNTKP
tara:strand:+ start:3394 stop:3792 length:399 start_codon:yes stop_codon:yes gene_type:complete